MQSKEQSVKLLKVGEFSVPNMLRVKIELTKKYKRVLFYPFYDRGVFRGIAVTVNKKPENGMPIIWNENGLKKTAIFNATHHKKKIWIFISKKKTQTVLL